MKPIHPILGILSVLAIFGIGFDKVVTQHQFDTFKRENEFRIKTMNDRLKTIEALNLAALEKQVEQMGCELLLSMLHEKRADKERLASMVETNLMGHNMADTMPYQKYVEGQIINLGSELRMIELKIDKSGC